MQKQIDTLMQREMTRKEFVATVGFGVASLMGIGSVLKLIKPGFGETAHKVSRGYGASGYGR